MRHPLPFFCLTFGGKVFLFFLLESVNFISRLLLLFHLECDQRLIEIEARFLYIFIISPLVDIITTGGSLFKKVFFLEIISCMSRSDFAVFIFLSFCVPKTTTTTINRHVQAAVEQHALFDAESRSTRRYFISRPFITGPTAAAAANVFSCWDDSTPQTGKRWWMSSYGASFFSGNFYLRCEMFLSLCEMIFPRLTATSSVKWTTERRLKLVEFITKILKSTRSFHLAILNGSYYFHRNLEDLIGTWRWWKMNRTATMEWRAKIAAFNWMPLIRPASR